MRIKNHVLNVSEETVLKELSSIVGENSLRVFPKLRVSDVLEKDIYLDQDYFSLYTRSHFDFLITSRDAKPFVVVEFEGPFHNNQEQNARDEKRTLYVKFGAQDALTLYVTIHAINCLRDEA